MRTIIRTTI